MPDIFISYSREDRPQAQRVASALEAGGFSVWWDAILRAGESYDEVTEANLRAAGAVVVLWSKKSSKSKWVRAEATIGERHSTLVPALIEDCDRPLRFELIQTADLTAWTGASDDRNWLGLIADIKNALAAKEATSGPEAAAASSPGAADVETIEGIFWSTIKDTDDPAELQAYLRRYKNGHFVDIAQRRLAAISAGKSQTGPVQPVAIRKGPPHPLIAIAIFAVATMIGMAMLVVANALHIGWFTWTPSAGGDLLDTGAKEIGFLAAINWSLAAIILMPAAWAMIYLALTEVQETWNSMAARRMIVADGFIPVHADFPGFVQMQRHIRLFVIGGGALVIALTVALAMSDHAKVAGKFYGDRVVAEKLDRIDDQGYALDAPDQERDWMIASLLSTPSPDKASINPNKAFSYAAYILYVGLGIGSLLSFGLIALGFGATFMRGVASNYGLAIIPDLQSNDPRCGFDAVRRFFALAFSIAFIGCVMCYLMGVQNLFLRSPDANILVFLAPDFASLAAADNWREWTNSLVGFLFADSAAKGTRNIYVWIFGFFIFAVFIGGFLALLRQGADNGKSIVLEELNARGVDRLGALTQEDKSALAARLQQMRIWPLDRPSLKTSLLIMAAFVVSFVFYKLGAVIILALALALPVMLWRSPT